MLLFHTEPVVQYCLLQMQLTSIQACNGNLKNQSVSKQTNKKLFLITTQHYCVPIIHIKNVLL